MADHGGGWGMASGPKVPAQTGGGAGPPRRILLIVDDWPQVGRSLRRCLAHGFDQVHLAVTQPEAEHYLAEHRPTHLLCDCVLGENLPLGTELIGRWRQQFPGIQLAALVTGSDMELITEGPGIDAVFRKPFDVPAMRQFLGVPEVVG